RLALAGASSLIVASAIAFAALSGEDGKPTCAPPARSAGQVWPDRIASAFAAAGRGELRDVFQRDFDAWRGERALACMAQKPAALQCLDGVIERFDAIRGALEHVTGDVPPDAV